MHGFIVMLFREYKIVLEWNWNLMPDSLETHVMIQNIFSLWYHVTGHKYLLMQVQFVWLTIVPNIVMESAYLFCFDVWYNWK